MCPKGETNLMTSSRKRKQQFVCDKMVSGFFCVYNNKKTRKLFKI